MQKNSKINPNQKLSLCMIVKNEEKNIARCLNSVKGLVDEIIVVDTGSIDNTIKIAKSMGAKIYNFNWIDDFSAARNYSIEKATGDWILILDADEEIPKESKNKIRSLLIDNDSDSDICFQIRIKNLDSLNSYIVSNYMVRMFNNSSQIRYKGRLHEYIDLTPINLSDEDIYIIHHGYKDLAFAKTKQIERNRPLLKKILEDPNESEEVKCGVKFYLGSSYINSGDFEDGIAYLKDSINKSIEINNHSSTKECFLLLIKYYCSINNFEESEKLFLQAESLVTYILDDGEYWYYKGLVETSDLNNEKALEYFIKSFDIYNDNSKTSFVKLTYLEKYFMSLIYICIVAVELNDFDTFFKYAKISLEEIDDKNYYLYSFKTTLADLFIRANNIDKAIEIHQNVINDYKNQDELNLSLNKLSNIYLRMNKFSEAIELQAKIHDPDKVKINWYKLIEILENEGNYIEAEKAYNSIIKILPYESETYKRRALNKVFQNKKKESLVDLEIAYKYSKSQEEKLNIALVNLQLGYQDIAISYIEKIILENPINYDAKLHLCKIYISNGDYDKSESLLNDLIQLDTNRIEAYAQLANLHLIKKELDKANTLFQKSLEIEPYNLHSLYSLSLINIELGNKKLSQKYVTEALKIDPYNEEILSLYSKIK